MIVLKYSGFRNASFVQDLLPVFHKDCLSRNPHDDEDQEVIRMEPELFLCIDDDKPENMSYYQGTEVVVMP